MFHSLIGGPYRRLLARHAFLLLVIKCAGRAGVLCASCDIYRKLRASVLNSVAQPPRFAPRRQRLIQPSHFFLHSRSRPRVTLCLSYIRCAHV